jgi:His-Xaa-Ser system radical SAM maturase HxsB
MTEEKTQGKGEYILGPYRHKKICGGHLVTTDYGSWTFLKEEEYNRLRKNELDEKLLGVLKTKGFVLAKDNVNNVVKEYRKKCSFLFQGTSLHIVIPTLRCNQKCVYCHANSKPLDSQNFDMNEVTAKKTVGVIFQSPSHAITIEFQGGEPLLRFDLVKLIVQYAKEKNKGYKKDLRFRLVTNLTLMTDEILEFLMKERIGVCTSLDGPKHIHDKNRGDYETVEKWIQKIKKKYALNAMMLITKHSLPYHKEIIDEYIRLGFDSVWIKPANALGAAIKNKNEAVCTKEEFLEFWKKSMEYVFEINKKKFLIENFSVILLKKILGEEDIKYVDLQSPCGAAISQLAYNYDGNIYTCDEGRQYDLFKLGNVENTYTELLTSKDALGMVTASITDFLTCDNCVYKPYCGVCPVCSYAETKNIVTRFPNRRCEIMKGMFDYVFEKLTTDEAYKNMFLKWLGINDPANTEKKF